MSPTQTRKPTEPSIISEPGEATEPPYNVILHNDWINSMGRVIYILKKVIPGMTIKKAMRTMWTAHTEGRAVAKQCHKELAELYEERLNAKGLMASIEPGE